jgi:class 3 adenylate cyclase
MSASPASTGRADISTREGHAMAEDHQQRRLSTILAADVFGYSRLTAENEEDALRTLKGHRGVIDRLIARHEGRIFNTAGDSVLAEFGSAVEAVRCAISIQEELRVRNAQIAENRRMDFRIGINVGDVLVDGDDLYGDGVNIAARLESIAAPGNICISGSVFALVKNKLSYGFEDIGPQTMKNIPEPVAAFRLTPALSAPQAPAAARSARGWALPMAAAAAAAVIAGAGIFYWAGRGSERIARPVKVPPPVSAPPSSASLSPDAAALERMKPYVGMTVQGISTVTGKPFEMTLTAGGAAEVKIELATAGQFIVDRGSWQIAPNGNFCTHYTRFAGGNRICRKPVVEDGVIKAYTWDHKPNPWVFKK